MAWGYNVLHTRVPRMLYYNTLFDSMIFVCRLHTELYIYYIYMYICMAYSYIYITVYVVYMFL